MIPTFVVIFWVAVAALLTYYYRRQVCKAADALKEGTADFYNGILAFWCPLVLLRPSKNSGYYKRFYSESYEVGAFAGGLLFAVVVSAIAAVCLRSLYWALTNV